MSACAGSKATSLFLSTAVLTVVPALIVPMIVQIIRHRPDSPTAFIRSRFAKWRVAERLISALPILLLMPFFFTAFSGAKSALSRLVPFYLDPHLVWLDHAIFGTDAWRLFRPLYDQVGVLVVFDGSYFFFFLALYCLMYFAAFSAGMAKANLQFLIAYALSWIVLGNVLAVILSSVGPCFYDQFYNSNRFAPLMALLHQADDRHRLLSVFSQQKLISDYREANHGIGAGI